MTFTRKVEVEFDARGARRWFGAIYLLRFLLGRRAAARAAEWVVYRCARFRLNGGPWRRGLPAGRA